MTYSNGNSFSGNFVKGVIEGTGVMIY